MDRNDFGFKDNEGCIVKCPVCGLVYQVHGLANEDGWCISVEDPEAIRCPNCQSLLVQRKGFGRKKGFRFRKGRQGHGGWGRQNRANKGQGGCIGLEQMEGTALRRRAIVAILVLR